MAAEASTLEEIGAKAPAEKTAVIIPDGGPALTYGALRAHAAALAGGLRREGIGAGDPLAIVLPNGVEFLVAFLAATWARAVAAPLNPAYTREEFTFYLDDIGVKGVIVPPGEHPAREAAAARELPAWEARLGADGRVALVRLGAERSQALEENAAADPPRTDDVAMFLHTSGTTSRPKGVPLTHGNLMASLANIVRTYALTPADTSLIVMPLFHVHGLLGATLSTLFSGGTVIVPPKFSAASFWAQARTHAATWYSAVPTIHQILLARTEQVDELRQPLRLIRSCSAALAPAVLAQLEARFGAPVLEAYGMTEASHQMASNPLPPAARKPGTVGMGTGVDVAVLDEQGRRLPPGTQGEVAIRGPNVMHGYHNNPEANAQAFSGGYFRTGDQGTLDAEGYLTLTGRLKELINRGGEKISPFEVDAALLEHPAVAEAVSFGVPHPKYGEDVAAAVVLKAGATATQDDLAEFCRGRLAHFKVPQRIVFASALPRTATGKIQRRHVAAVFSQNPG